MRPDTGAPDFVTRSAYQRYAFAAAYLAGTSVLDVGAGVADASLPLRHVAAVYRACDMEPEPGSGVIEAVLPADAGKLEPADTVVAFEVFDHTSPDQQFGFLEACWSLARRRFILSTPDTDARRWYPQTDVFFGVDNPDHLRELPGWKLRRYLTRACPGGIVTLVPNGLDESDVFVTGAAGMPAASWFAVVDRA